MALFKLNPRAKPFTPIPYYKLHEIRSHDHQWINLPTHKDPAKIFHILNDHENRLWMRRQNWEVAQFLAGQIPLYALDDHMGRLMGRVFHWIRIYEADKSNICLKPFTWRVYGLFEIGGGIGEVEGGEVMSGWNGGAYVEYGPGGHIGMDRAWGAGGEWIDNQEYYQSGVPGQGFEGQRRDGREYYQSGVSGRNFGRSDGGNQNAHSEVRGHTPHYYSQQGVLDRDFGRSGGNDHVPHYDHQFGTPAQNFNHSQVGRQNAEPYYSQYEVLDRNRTHTHATQPYTHSPAPAQNSTLHSQSDHQNYIESRLLKKKTVCSVCRKTGHEASGCFGIHPELLAKYRAEHHAKGAAQEICSACGKVGHEESGCYVMHPELLVEYRAGREAKRAARENDADQNFVRPQHDGQPSGRNSGYPHLNDHHTRDTNAAAGYSGYNGYGHTTHPYSHQPMVPSQQFPHSQPVYYRREGGEAGEDDGEYADIYTAAEALGGAPVGYRQG